MNTLRAVLAPIFFASVLILTGCEQPTSLEVTHFNNPAPDEARLPSLTSQGDSVILSWVENHPASLPDAESSDEDKTKSEPGHSLRLSRYQTGSGWNDPATVATGAQWFVNWADFPGVHAVDNTRLAAHWLRRSGKSTYAYDVVTSLSNDGTRWSKPYVPHLDGTKTEHGFVSFFTQNGQPSLAWLDGRNTDSTGGGHADHSEASSSAMSLRTRALSNADGGGSTLTQPSTLLDTRVCDCCQTAATNTDAGAIVFYRDRTENEIRDVAYVRYDEASGTWSKPKRLHDDGWQIQGCPVNGPQAVAQGEYVAVTWFTASPSPRVMLAVSTDSGATFSSATVVSQVQPLGRVSLTLLSKHRVLVSWLEQSTTDTARLLVSLFDDGPGLVATTEVAQISAARQSGFPRLATLTDDSALISWTNWSNHRHSINTARVDILSITR